METPEDLKTFPQDGAWCRCLGEDAPWARYIIRKAARIDELIDESHFIVAILRCGGCGQLFLKVFTELIDWTNGDDSQAWMYMPIDAEEAQQLRSANPFTERTLLDMKFNRRFLSDVFPSGGERRIVWGTGPLVILPHD